MKKSDMVVEYEIINKLGEQGCFGEVFLAKDINIGRKIVVKEIPYFKISDKSNFFNESQKLYKAKHPNIAEIYYAGFKDKIYGNKKYPEYHNKTIKHICLSMAYYENGSLEQAIKNNEIKSEQILKIFHNLLQGVHCIHAQGLIHLDLKPDNILFDKKMVPIISDFGVAQYFNTEGYTHDPIMPIFLKSPESAKYILEGYKNVESQQTDIYQLGVIFYLILKNYTFAHFKTEVLDIIRSKGVKEPTKENLYKVIKNGSIFDLKEVNKDERLIKMVKKMLHINPDKRYNKILHVLNDLSKIKYGI